MGLEEVVDIFGYNARVVCLDDRRFEPPGYCCSLTEQSDACPLDLCPVATRGVRFHEFIILLAVVVARKLFCSFPFGAYPLETTSIFRQLLEINWKGQPAIWVLVLRRFNSWTSGLAEDFH